MSGFVAIGGLVFAAGHGWVTGAIIRYLLAAIFLYAGTFKIAQPAWATRALVAFGIVTNARAWSGRTLGFAEVMIGLMLALPWTAPVGGIVALAATAVFLIVIVKGLVTGNHSPCYCFSAHSSPISAVTVIRGVGLLLAAAFTVVQHYVGETDTGLAENALAASVAVSALGGIGALSASRQSWNAATAQKDRLDWEWIHQEADYYRRVEG